MTVKFSKVGLLHIIRTNAHFKFEIWVIALLISIPLILSFSLNQVEDIKCNS